MWKEIIEINDFGTVIKVNRLADELREGILNSGSKIKISGRAYYFSQNGDDGNDGLSPDTPLKTLKQISNIDFCPGDSVLLERGSLFRGGISIDKPGILLSAYGTGDKPKIYGSLRNYNRISDWQETDVKDVYCCSETFEFDVGNIVFDEGRRHAFKQLVGNFGFNGRLSALNSDLMMYYSDLDKKLYLCSKGGNPANRFNSIEICTFDALASIKADGITVDNICFKYGGGHAVCGSERKNVTVQNCEFGWIGGCVQFFDEEKGKYVRFGNAIEIYADVENFTACYNYIYQIYDAGITHQFFYDVSRKMSMTNCNYHHNLIEYCTYSIEYALMKQSTDKDYSMKNITISDNIMRYAGYGFGDQRPDKENSAHIKSWDLENRSENFIVENNIIDEGKYDLIHIASAEGEWLPKLSGNTYIQNQGGSVGRYGVLPAQVYSYSQTDEFLKSVENSTFHIIRVENRKII